MSYYMTRPTVRYYPMCRKPEPPLYETEHPRQMIPLDGLGWGTLSLGGGITPGALVISGLAILGVLAFAYAYWPTEQNDQLLYRDYLRAHGRA
jgi:hypothetical protein